MRATPIPAFALAMTLAAPALAQQTPTVILVPGGAQQAQPSVAPQSGQQTPSSVLAQGGAQESGQGQQYALVQQGQNYMLVPVPRNPVSPMTESSTGTAQSSQSGLLDRYTREIFERAYTRGRLDERQAGGSQLSEVELERLAQQLFVRGYVHGRVIERAMQGGLDADQLRQVRQDLAAARQAIGQGNPDQARQVLDRIEQQLPTAQTAGTQQGSQSSQPGPQQSAGPMTPAAPVLVHPSGPGAPGAQAAEAASPGQASVAPMEGIKKLHPTQDQAGQKR